MADWVIATNWGIGDAYLVASLCKAFREQNGGRVVVACKAAHRDLVTMFPGVDEVIDVAALAPCSAPQLTLRRGETFWAHPSTVRVRPDFAVAHGKMTDLAMYALILGLPPSTEASLPVVPAAWHHDAARFAERTEVDPGRTVLLFPTPSSWPSTDVAFWQLLMAKLLLVGFTVRVNDPTELPLRLVIPFVEICGWAIGAQCGIMQMIVSSRAACRKTIVTQSIAGTAYPLPVADGVGLPYRLMRTVDGNQYDVEERLIKGPEDWDRVTSRIARGRNAEGGAFSRSPLPFFEAPTTPGEIIDRLTILRIKAAGIPSKRHSFEREICELELLRDRIVAQWPRVAEFEKQLAAANGAAFDHNAILIATFDGTYARDPGWRIDVGALPDVEKATRSVREFAAAHAANVRRVAAKNEINKLVGTTFEEKEYN